MDDQPSDEEMMSPIAVRMQRSLDAGYRTSARPRKQKKPDPGFIYDDDVNIADEGAADVPLANVGIQCWKCASAHSDVVSCELPDCLNGLCPACLDPSFDDALQWLCPPCSVRPCCVCHEHGDIRARKLIVCSLCLSFAHCSCWNQPDFTKIDSDFVCPRCTCQFCGVAADASSLSLCLTCMLRFHARCDPTALSLPPMCSKCRDKALHIAQESAQGDDEDEPDRGGSFMELDMLDFSDPLVAEVGDISGGGVGGETDSLVDELKVSNEHLDNVQRLVALQASKKRPLHFYTLYQTYVREQVFDKAGFLFLVDCIGNLVSLTSAQKTTLVESLAVPQKIQRMMNQICEVAVLYKDLECRLGDGVIARFRLPYRPLGDVLVQLCTSPANLRAGPVIDISAPPCPGQCLGGYRFQELVEKFHAAFPDDAADGVQYLVYAAGSDETVQSLSKSHPLIVYLLTTYHEVNVVNQNTAVMPVAFYPTSISNIDISQGGTPVPDPAEYTNKAVVGLCKSAARFMFEQMADTEKNVYTVQMADKQARVRFLLGLKPADMVERLNETGLIKTSFDFPCGECYNGHRADAVPGLAGFNLDLKRRSDATDAQVRHLVKEAEADEDFDPKQTNVLRLLGMPEDAAASAFYRPADGTYIFEDATLLYPGDDLHNLDGVMRSLFRKLSKVYADDCQWMQLAKRFGEDVFTVPRATAFHMFERGFINMQRIMLALILEAEDSRLKAPWVSAEVDDLKLPRLCADLVWVSWVCKCDAPMDVAIQLFSVLRRMGDGFNVLAKAVAAKELAKKTRKRNKNKIAVDEEVPVEDTTAAGDDDAGGVISTAKLHELAYHLFGVILRYGRPKLYSTRLLETAHGTWKRAIARFNLRPGQCDEALLRFAYNRAACEDARFSALVRVSPSEPFQPVDVYRLKRLVSKGLTLLSAIQRVFKTLQAWAGEQLVTPESFDALLAELYSVCGGTDVAFGYTLECSVECARRRCCIKSPTDFCVKSTTMRDVRALSFAPDDAAVDNPACPVEGCVAHSSTQLFPTLYKAANSVFGIPLLFVEHLSNADARFAVVIALQATQGFAFDDVTVRHALTPRFSLVPFGRIRDTHMALAYNDFVYVMRGGSRAYLHLA